MLSAEALHFASDAQNSLEVDHVGVRGVLASFLGVVDLFCTPPALAQALGFVEGVTPIGFSRLVACWPGHGAQGSLFQKHRSQYSDCFYTTSSLEGP